MYWFPFTVLGINVLIIIFMRKHLTIREIYTTWAILCSITFVTDLITGASLDLFDFGPSSKVEIRTTILEAFLPASFGIIFLNYIPQKKKSFIFYLVIWVVFSTFFEWLTIKFHYLTYKGWKLWYSTCFYTLIFLFMRLHLWFIRKKTR